MTNPEDFLGADSFQTEKLERFESSTVELVLKQLGASPGFVRGKSKESGDGLTCDWFNMQEYIMPTLYTTRFFNFNFQDLFLRPSRHEITKAVCELPAFKSRNPFVSVFKVYDVGRMIATNCVPVLATYIHIPVDHRVFYVCHFTGFFTELFGTPLERESL
jgi:hypothetical protein